jgi:hypothetical protein
LSTEGDANIGGSVGGGDGADLGRAVAASFFATSSEYPIDKRNFVATVFHTVDVSSAARSLHMKAFDE